jgi:DNA-binding NtrC family response regulator
MSDVKFKPADRLAEQDNCDEAATAVTLGKPAENPVAAPFASLRRLRAEAEIRAISLALMQTGWNRRRAAQLLSVSYRGLLYKIREHNITPEKE